MNIDFDMVDRNIKQSLSNKYVSQAITLVIVLYAVLVAPRLSRNMYNIVDNQIVKLIVFFSIAYFATADYKISLALVLAYFITVQTCEKHRINDQLVSVIVAEQMSNGKKENIVAPEEEMTKHVETEEEDLTIPQDDVKQDDDKHDDDKQDKQDESCDDPVPFNGKGVDIGAVEGFDGLGAFGTRISKF